MPVGRGAHSSSRERARRVPSLPASESDDRSDCSRRHSPSTGSVGAEEGVSMTPGSAPTALSPWQFDLYVSAEADGYATPEQLAVLAADPVGWRSSLLRLLQEAEEHVERARSLSGDERAQVVADLESERRLLADAWARLTSERITEPAAGDRRAARNGRGSPPALDGPVVPGIVELQVSWEPGWVVAWAAGPHTPRTGVDEVRARLAAAGAPASGWTKHGAVPLPDSATTDSLAIPVGDV